MQNKRWLRLPVVLLVAGLALAACGSDKKNASSSSSAKGCSNIAVGFFGALTGESANLGVNERNGMKVALDEYNKANATCQVKLKEYDSQGSPDQAPQLAQKVIGEKDVIALVGPAFSGESKVADPIFSEAGLPTITASATNPGLAKNGWKTFHRAVGNDNAQGPAAASYLTGDAGAKRIAVIDDASEYGKGIADIVRTKVKDAGATVVASEAIDPKGTDFSSTVTKVRSANADAVFFGGYYQAAGVLVKQLRDAGVKATFVAPDGSNDPGFVQAAGAAAAEGAILTAPAAPIDKVDGGQKFKDDYKSLNGVDVGLYSVEAYDSTNAILEGIKAGNTSREKLNTYLGSTLDFKGLSKTLKFNAQGELDGTVTVWAYKVEGSKINGLKELKGS